MTGDGHLSLIRTDAFVCSMLSSETLTNEEECLLESQVLISCVLFVRLVFIYTCHYINSFFGCVIESVGFLEIMRIGNVMFL